MGYETTAVKAERGTRIAIGRWAYHCRNCGWQGSTPPPIDQFARHTAPNGEPCAHALTATPVRS